MSEKEANESAHKVVGNRIDKYLIQTSAVHMNVGQEFIVTTEDKVHRCLQKWETRIHRRDAWLTPLGVLLTLVFGLTTTTPHDAFALPKETWLALWILGIVAASIWLLKALFARVRNGKMEIEHVVNELKRTAGTPADPRQRQP